MFLFIFENIGTSELILIATVALIVFGPRKLPEMAKTIAKMMAEFRNATNEFKTTWEKEVSFEATENTPEIKTIKRTENLSTNEDSTAEIQPQIETENPYPKPLIKQLDTEEINKNFQNAKEISENTASVENQNKNTNTDKRDWL